MKVSRITALQAVSKRFYQNSSRSQSRAVLLLPSRKAESNMGRVLQTPPFMAATEKRWKSNV
jgi:hypothetical protein